MLVDSFGYIFLFHPIFNPKNWGLKGFSIVPQYKSVKILFRYQSCIPIVLFLFPQLSENEDSPSKAVELYQARLEQSYEEQCALALKDKKAVLQRVMNEKQNGD